MKTRKIENWILSICLPVFFFYTVVFSSAALADTVRKEIRVGTHLPLSGIMASIGKELRWSYEASVADINKTGGIYILEYDKKLPVRLVVMDDASDPSVVVTSVSKLINDEKVDFLLSGYTAVYGVIPGCIVAESNQIYYHAVASLIPPWQAHHFGWSTLLFFDMEQSASMPFEIWNSLPKEKRPRRAALIMEDTYDGIALSRLLHKKASEYGYKFILDTYIPLRGKNFTTQILKAKEMGVDAIFLFAPVADSITFIRQMKEHHLSVNFLQGWKGTWPAEFSKVLGKDAQGVLSDGHWSKSFPYTGARELGERFYKVFGYDSTVIGTYYALSQILWQAIEKAGTINSAMVRSAVLKNEFNTTMGKINYDLKGVARYPSLTLQWRNGKQEIIYPFEFATTKLQIPPVKDKVQ
ncbi:MAG: amino acid ABC transporter substrate-binding protein [Desulfobacterium sp.]